MGKLVGFLVVLFLVFAGGYFLFWPTGLAPQAWVAPQDEGLTGDFVPNDLIARAQKMELSGRYGPEDIAIGVDGWLYTGVSDGSVIRVDPATGDFDILAITGGRPLGVEFDAGGNLLVADAYKGLVSIAMDGTVTILADQAGDGSIIGYADDVDVTPDGRIWFSDASTKFFPGDWGGTLEASVAEIWEHAGTGRILSYDPETGEMETHMTGLVFANGVAADPAGQFILVSETGKYRVLKYWLAGPEKGKTEVLVDNLPGFPDNINPDSAGGYFVGLVTPRSADVDAFAEKPLLRNILWRIPGFEDAAAPPPYSHLIRIDANGNVLETWQDPAGSYTDITGAVRGADGSIYVSSLQEGSIAHISP
ncbi:SMP-30/gluconolactonase/LRE family protein [Parvularcula sp. IMCC14364]|uniref:SMP-30/gluconolactonase/LRE family protein n=1 Tax=Parvularcula sp. IMCC14364 TaxID=3067902 RepID=UPI0027406C4F|nr:SMP-30/gluconolactonase/LRE family protein [Parvularcula sp. IMCC14364]